LSETEFWQRCYSGAFDLISPESFAHPAKMAPSLCYRIIEHLEELGLLKAGATILDPMGGTGLTAICANAKGYRTGAVKSSIVLFVASNLVNQPLMIHPWNWTKVRLVKTKGGDCDPRRS